MARTKKKERTIDVTKIINDIISTLINFKDISNKIIMNIKVKEVKRKKVEITVKDETSITDDEDYEIIEYLIIVFSNTNYSVFNKIKHDIKKSIGVSLTTIDNLIENIYKSWISIPFWNSLRKYNNRKIGDRNMVITFKKSDLGFMTTVTVPISSDESEDDIIKDAINEIKKIFKSVYIEVEDEIDNQLINVEKCRDNDVCILCRMDGFPICIHCSTDIS